MMPYCTLQHLNHCNNGMKRDSFVTTSTDEQGVHCEVKLYLCKSPIRAYYREHNCEHIKPIWTQSFWPLAYCAWVVPWIWDNTGNTPITHTHPQRQRDKDREGQKVFSLLNLGVIIGWGGRRIFPRKPSSSLSRCRQQQFSPSELIGASVAALCRWTKTTEETRKESNKERLQGAEWSQRMGLLCHRTRVRYNHTAESCSKVARDVSTGACVMIWADKLWISSITRTY